MAEVRACSLDDEKSFARFREFFEQDNRGLRLTRLEVNGDDTLHCEQGGMRVFWIYRGGGSVFLPKGYRTQEGDGQRLTDDYRADEADPALAETLRILTAGMASLSPAAQVAIDAIVGRWNGHSLVGDFSGELWKLDHLPRPWTCQAQVDAAIAWLFQNYRGHGWSTKQVDSWELLQEGDQLIACPGDEIRVNGRFACLAMENIARPTSHVSTVRRLRLLADTAGGCNPDFDPFRRLPLTWAYNCPGETGDGLNWVNSHVVNIPKETSPSHFHPLRGIAGCEGVPQREMYLVLDPQTYQLDTWGRKASLVVYPDLRDLRRYEQHPLEPGMFIYIPPGTGHRGLDVFVNVLTIPGFKPHNEYYIDCDIRNATAGTAPYNENLLEIKNYGRIEDLI